MWANIFPFAFASASANFSQVFCQPEEFRTEAAFPYLPQNWIYHSCTQRLHVRVMLQSFIQQTRTKCLLYTTRSLGGGITVRPSIRTAQKFAEGIPSNKTILLCVRPCASYRGQKGSWGSYAHKKIHSNWDVRCMDSWGWEEKFCILLEIKGTHSWNGQEKSQYSSNENTSIVPKYHFPFLERQKLKYRYRFHL